MSSFVQQSGTKLLLKAYAGDAKTLLAFNLPDERDAKNLAGFTIQCKPDGQSPYFIHNTLRFENPGDHAQDQSQPPNASINAPIHKFRWIHIPGSVHQGISPFLGEYTYTATPRYFNDGGILQPLDPSLSVSLTIKVVPFAKGNIELGFTRGFTQSQAFVNHFGLHAPIEPKGEDNLVFDTTAIAGTNAQGQNFTFDDEYGWLGFTARQKILSLLKDVVEDEAKYLDVFAYDLNEPTIVSALLELAKQGRIRIILDDAALHHSETDSKPEDVFEKQFVTVAKSMSETDATERSKQPTQILRGHFERYAHDKILIVYQGDTPVKVLTGSTNYSITGLYVNSNHVIGYEDKEVVAKYADLFNTAWSGSAKLNAFVSSPISNWTFSTSKSTTPRTEITFAPHTKAFASQVLQSIADRINEEGKQVTTGSVLFAVMALDEGSGPVLDALKQVHKNQKIFSYGISDSTDGICLYAPGKTTGVLVTGKPAKTKLPPPFNQVRNIGGIGHQVHHKFVVCGFNGDNPVVYCGSSNLALGGETHNADNLLAIYGPDVATAFAIEALALVDHFDFLDRLSSTAKQATENPPAMKSQAAADAQWFLSTNDTWAKPYFDPGDLHCVDRLLFA
ncbi:phospholipase D-like domain-containing protein [Paraburkholderia diazotrophica]|uniref:phospholipase D n=1 Tax=Paraburkholderia diazotrophica TaxID=667676 RepID=A0A1H7CQY0_9BURK|nr:phospholipase D-like domain-containing protein [Paraburkholderia diazotrophica]SEJ90967.1 PLD-like domain-containing protein [Paraburkholderia diazotrophica]